MEGVEHFGSQPLAVDLDSHVDDQAMQALVSAIDQSMAVVEFSLDGRVLKANDRFLALVGFEHTGLIGQHHSLLRPPGLVAEPAYAMFWTRLRHASPKAASTAAQAAMAARFGCRPRTHRCLAGMARPAAL